MSDLFQDEIPDAPVNAHPVSLRSKRAGLGESMPNLNVAYYIIRENNALYNESGNNIYFPIKKAITISFLDEHLAYDADAWWLRNVIETLIQKWNPRKHTQFYFEYVFEKSKVGRLHIHGTLICNSELSYDNFRKCIRSVTGNWKVVPFRDEGWIHYSLKEKPVIYSLQKNLYLNASPKGEVSTSRRRSRVKVDNKDNSSSIRRAGVSLVEDKPPNYVDYMESAFILEK